MSEKHIGEVVQVTGPVLDIRFPEGRAAGTSECHRDRQPTARSWLW